MASTYEEAILRGSLTAEQKEALVVAFTRRADILGIAAELDLPVHLVLKYIENGDLAFRALAAKRYSAVIQFMGIAIDRLLLIVQSPASTAKEVIAATRLLVYLLGLRGNAGAAPSDEDDEEAPEPAAEPVKKVEPTKSLEAILAALDG